MNEMRENLVALAACEEALLHLERERLRIPQAIAEWEARLEAARQELEAQKNALETAERSRRANEAELQDCEERRERYQAQTPLVKTNQEYTALLHEIEAVNSRIGEVEEGILLAMEGVDTARAEIERAEAEQGQREQEVQREIARLRQRLEEVGREVELRRGEEEERLSRLEPASRSLYTRLKKTNRAATARLRGRCCSACNRDVPYEVINRILAGELQSCVNCQRILVVPEEDGEEPA